MSQLVQLGQRIKAVETIKKITHAMRLIAMSSHTRLKQRESSLLAFSHELQNLLQKVAHKRPQDTAVHRRLIILISSQKGLCGNFNSMLFKFCDKELVPLLKDADVICVGKKARKYLAAHSKKPLLHFDGLGLSSLSSIAHQLGNFIINRRLQYKETIIGSNKPVSFFIQRPELTKIGESSAADQQANDLDEYIWEEDTETVSLKLHNLAIRTHIESILFESLLAEQSARFRTMDSATRNADQLLESMKRQFNKLRQAKITKELLELSGAAHADK